jgi:PPOX class probable F420-dependent enzyme
MDRATEQETIGGLLIRRLDALDKSVCRLLEAQNVCTVCTFALDGSIHAQPVWVDTDGEDVLLNSVGDRAWVRNLKRSPRVTCNVLNLQNPYEFVEIRGRACAATRTGADEHIHRMARKYLGLEEYPWMSADQPRLLVRVRPERIVHMYPGDDELQS